MSRETPSAQLRHYERDKFELAEIMRLTAVSAARAGGSWEEARKKEIDALLTRLAEDRFVLLVVGRFSRGKTSLMNAILRMDRLPTGVLPLTSVITIVAYGSSERVRLEFQTGGLPVDIPMSRLADHITERGNPGNRRRIRSARVELPAEILRRGFHFVDSPGLGSAIQENSRTTESFFPEADAVIVVSAFDGALSEEEAQAIRTFAETGRPVFLVLNKQDLVPVPARAEVMAFARERLAGSLPGGKLRIFAMSARDGLAASLRGDEDAFASSGVAEFETALVRFLVDDKRSVFITGLCDRVRRLIDQTGCEVGNGVLKERLKSIRERWSGEAALEEGADRRAAAVRDVRLDECLLCARVRDTVYEFLRKYQYELTVNAQAREVLASAGGLCGPHLWLYGAMSADRDLCLALTPLVRRTASALTQEATVEGELPSAGAQTLAAPSCELCAIQRRVEVCAVEELLSRRESDDRLPTVCVPHLRLIAQHGDPTRRLLGALCERQGTAAERLAEDMERYVLKRDGTRRALVTEEETQAAQRALAFLGGARAVPFT